MYSLLNASLLGFDLVRREGGGSVADLLCRMLELRRSDVVVLAHVYVHQASATVARAARIDGREDSLSAVVRQSAALVSDDRFGEAAEVMARAAVGNLANLHALVRREIAVLADADPASLEPSLPSDVLARAADVLGDAITADYHATSLDPSTRAALLNPWRQALPRLGGLEGLAGPGGREVRVTLDRLRAADDRTLHLLDKAAERLRARGAWSKTMHTATWAVHLSGRVRDAARVQLKAVTALRTAGVGHLNAAAGVWNLVSGALQAAVVQDLLDESTGRLLTSDLARALELRER